MSPELKTAVQERVDLGHSKEAIADELRTAGYDDATIEMVYQAVAGEPHTDIPPAEEAPNFSQPDSAQFQPNTPPATGPTASASLPSSIDLLQNGWMFLTQRPDLLAILVLPNFLATAATFAFTDEFLQFVVSLCAALAYFVALGMLLHTVTHLDRKVSLGESFEWIKVNAGGYIWISILSVLVVWGGFLLLIIPGLIFGVYISLAQYAFASENTRGVSALSRSYQLVKGHWWALAVRIFLLAILVFLVVFTLFFAVGLVASGFGAVSEMVTEFGSVIVSAAASMIFFQAYSRIYQQLANVKPVETIAEGEKKGNGMYVGLAFLGLLFPIFIIIAVTAGMRIDSDSSLSTQDVLQLRAQLSVVQIDAVMYESETGGYAGVCSAVRPTITAADTVRCNDNSNGWALSARIGTDMWCVDSTGYDKRIEKSLGERTACLDLPTIP